MTQRSPIAIAVSRFGFPTLTAGSLSREGASARLLSDLDPDAVAISGELPSTGQSLRAMVAKREIARAGAAADTMRAVPGDPDEARSKFEPELRAGLAAARAQQTGFAERLVLHWSNHFTVSAVTGKVGWSIAPFAREVIRPHLFGRFEAMLTAATTHPAMLFYLDNQSSIGPNSTVGLRRGAGLNENLARELLELHTLGVDGGYDTNDIGALARILTGWTVDIKPGSPTCGDVVFDPRRHEPGSKRLLGRTITESGPDELRDALHLLATHPATARNVSRRLAIGFLGDAPPEALLRALSADFQRSGGDLRSLAATLVASDVMWTEPPRKLRPPIEMLYAADRLLGTAPVPPTLVKASGALGQPFLRAPSPKGWAQEDDAWVTPDGIKSRLDWSAQVAGQLGDRFTSLPLREAASSRSIGEHTHAMLAGAESPAQALTLLLMSPEFQRR